MFMFGGLVMVDRNEPNVLEIANEIFQKSDGSFKPEDALMSENVYEAEIVIDWNKVRRQQADPKLDSSDHKADGFSKLLLKAIDAINEGTDDKFLSILTEDSYSAFCDARDRLNDIVERYSAKEIDMTTLNYADAMWEAAMQLPERGPELTYSYEDTAQTTENSQVIEEPDYTHADAMWEAAMQLPERGPELTYSYEDTAQTVDSHLVRNV